MSGNDETTTATRTITVDGDLHIPRVVIAIAATMADRSVRFMEICGPTFFDGGDYDKDIGDPLDPDRATCQAFADGLTRDLSAIAPGWTIASVGVLSHYNGISVKWLGGDAIEVTEGGRVFVSPVALREAAQP